MCWAVRAAELMQRHFLRTTSIMGVRVLALLLLALALASASELPRPKRILVLHSFRNALPINSQLSEGIREGLDLPGNQPVEIDSEALDLSGVNDEEYVRKLIEVFGLKYRASPPHLIIATYTPAAQLLLDHRRELFPGIPIVFCSAEFSSEDLDQLPPGITGVTSKRDFAGTVELMSRLQPDMRQIAVIIGSSGLDASWERDARKALGPFETPFEFIWLRGLPLGELTESVRALPSHTAILYVLQLGDRDGVSYVPRKVAQAVAKSASVPVYGLWDTLMGSGIVGGRLIALEQQSVVAGTIARRLLRGEAPAAIPVVRMERNEVVVDARQLKRWNIDERLLPDGSRVLNREDSLWEQHRGAMLLTGALIALQALWIAVLSRNRRNLKRAKASQREEHDHRMQAEELTQRLRARLGSEEKQSSLGALAGRIAHEINQPLIAIKNYAQAARRYIPNASTKGGKLAELLAEMEGEADRAGSIIQKIRTLLSSERVDAVRVDLDPVLKEVVAVMKPEADAHGCRIDYRATAPVPIVLVDALQVQLVVVNLLRNAMEAAASHDRSGDGSVSIVVGEAADRMVQVSVADTGPGVPAEEIEDIFESLYSTKEAGMGVGLATCRTIIEAHGGRIWCTPNPAGGAIFHFTVPAAEAGD
jgi:signal transduction histidine kinase